MNNDVNLGDFLEELIERIEERKKEKEKSEKLKQLEKALQIREKAFYEHSLDIPEAKEIRNFCLWYSKNIQQFIYEIEKFDNKRCGFFLKLNVKIICNGIAVVENLYYWQYIDWELLLKFRKRGIEYFKDQRFRKNYFVIFLEENDFRYVPISGKLYRSMREGDAKEIFFNWLKKGKKIRVWDFKED